MNNRSSFEQDRRRLAGAPVDPSATAAEYEHFEAIARHLSGPRRRALELVERCGPSDLSGLMACWATTHPDDVDRFGNRLPHLATGLLWKLEALDWIDATGDSYRVTQAGRDVLAG